MRICENFDFPGDRTWPFDLIFKLKLRAVGSVSIAKQHIADFVYSVMCCVAAFQKQTSGRAGRAGQSCVSDHPARAASRALPFDHTVLLIGLQQHCGELFCL